MKKIIYYVASSLDGYISGENDDISAFAQKGSGVDKYLSDLQSFKTVIMGRKTYEFGYQYGLVPGYGAYPDMDHYIFSNNLKFDDQAENVHVSKLNIDIISDLKSTSESDIYLCGGGEFAGWLLENDLIDEIKVKLNPIILGGGIRLFGSSAKKANLELIKQESYADCFELMTYKINKVENR